MAARLGVDEVSLRMSIDPLAPYPTLDVLSAIITAYGVDPTWLITGEYNSSTHREAESQPDRTLSSLRGMLGSLPASAPTPEQPTLRLLKDA